MSPRVMPRDLDVSRLLIDAFRPRMDVYAQRLDDQAAVDRLNAWQVEHTKPGERSRVWKLGDWKPAGRRGSRTAVTPEAIARHVAGIETLGLYPLRPDGNCGTISADFDNHRGSTVIKREPRLDFDATVAMLERIGMPYLAHHSRGGHGYWIHVLPPAETSAREARAVMSGILCEAGVQHITKGGTFDALCPKQDALAPPEGDDPTARPGNLFCLPLNGRWLAGDPPGTGFVGVSPADVEAQVVHLRVDRRITTEHWAALVARYPVAPDPRPTPAARATRAAPPGSDDRMGGCAGTDESILDRAWEIALSHAGRVGADLGDGKRALLCLRDHLHSVPDGDVGHAGGGTVVFPPSAAHPHGWPWCNHGHCADLTEADWIAAVGVEAWEDALLEARGWRRAGPYLLHADGISMWRRVPYPCAAAPARPGRNAPETDVPTIIVPGQPLANFGARIVSDIEEVAGEGAPARVFLVEARVQGRIVRVPVPAQEYAGMGWVPMRLGPAAVVAAGRDRRDQIREAIQLLSIPISRRTVFTQIGWTKFEGRWIYVHGDGAVGAEAVEVALPTPDLARFALPAPPTGADLVRCVRRCIDLFWTEPAVVSVPLYAAVWRAALGRSRVTVYLQGDATSGKTFRASLAQQHFGAGLDEEHPPITWLSTAGSIEALLAVVGDAVFLIDDFRISGATAADADLCAKAERVIRGQFAGVGTARLTREARLRAPAAPRALPIVTGETLPPGYSTGQRMLVLEVTERGVDLSAFREDGRAGVFARAMAAFQARLAPRRDDVLAGLPRDVARHAATLGVDPRTAGLVADLAVGFDAVLAWAREVGALDEGEAEDLARRARAAFLQLAQTQARRPESQHPAKRFVALIAAALAGGRCHLATQRGTSPHAPSGWGWTIANEGARTGPRGDAPQQWRPSGACVGYLHEGRVYLLRETALAEARLLAERTGNPLPIDDPRYLTKLLDQAGLLVRTETREDVRTARLRVGGRTLTGLLCLAVDSLGGESESAAEPCESGTGTVDQDENPNSCDRIEPTAECASGAGDGGAPVTETTSERSEGTGQTPGRWNVAAETTEAPERTETDTTNTTDTTSGPPSLAAFAVVTAVSVVCEADSLASHAAAGSSTVLDPTALPSAATPGAVLGVTGTSSPAPNQNLVEKPWGGGTREGQTETPPGVPAADRGVAEVRARLRGWPPADREAYEERAAILEYDGGFPRERAERRAFDEVSVGLDARTRAAAADPLVVALVDVLGGEGEEADRHGRRGQSRGHNG